MVSKHAHHSSERADICWRRIILEGAKSLLIWFDDNITHAVTKYVDRCLRFHRFGFIEGKTSPLNCFMELLHIFIMFLLVSPCYCNVVQIWEGVLESFPIDHLVHRSLEHGNSAGHTKTYTTELVESLIDFKTCVLPIRFCYWHLVIGTFQVKCWVHFVGCQIVYHIVISRKRVGIKVCVLIDSLRIVYAKSLFCVPIQWVFRHNHLCTPRRRTDLNNTLGEKLRNLWLNEILVMLAETPGFTGDTLAIRKYIWEERWLVDCSCRDGTDWCWVLNNQLRFTSSKCNGDPVVFFLEVMAEDDVTTKVFENTKACACVDMLIEIDVCKTVANDVCSVHTTRNWNLTKEHWPNESYWPRWATSKDTEGDCQRDCWCTVCDLSTILWGRNCPIRLANSTNICNI